jgi:hypothetical protein
MNQRPTIQDALSSLKGKPAWRLSRSHGSMFFMEIGEPLERPGLSRIHGEWHFLVESCPWRFETPDSIILGSGNEQQLIDSAFEKFNLGLVEFAEMASPAKDLLIRFSSGVLFRTFTISAQVTAECTHWILYGPENYVWASNGSGNIERSAINEPV